MIGFLYQSEGITKLKLVAGTDNESEKGVLIIRQSAQFIHTFPTVFVRNMLL